MRLQRDGHGEMGSRTPPHSFSGSTIEDASGRKLRLVQAMSSSGTRGPYIMVLLPGEIDQEWRRVGTQLEQRGQTC